VQIQHWDFFYGEWGDLRDLVHHLPKSCYYRRASYKPDGRRKDAWVFARRATLHTLGDVTIVLSKKRRNDGPKGVKIIVTTLTEASVGAILSIYARRWGVEISQSYYGSRQSLSLAAA
jgi:hypothetical protein